MAIITRVNSFLDYRMDMANVSLMVISILESLLMVLKRVMAKNITSIAFIGENGSMIYDKAVGIWSGKTDATMRENFIRMICMVKVNMFGLMAESM
jgi:hypothetical protein